MFCLFAYFINLSTFAADLFRQPIAQSLVDTFISRIELFNDGMEILYNAHDGQNNVPLGEPQGSPKGRLVEHLNPKANSLTVMAYGFAVAVRL